MPAPIWHCATISSVASKPPMCLVRPTCAAKSKTVFLLIALCLRSSRRHTSYALNGQQREAEVKDPVQDAVQRCLVGDRPMDARLAAGSGHDLKPAEPAGLVAVEHALHPDFVDDLVLCSVDHRRSFFWPSAHVSGCCPFPLWLYYSGKLGELSSPKLEDTRWGRCPARANWSDLRCLLLTSEVCRSQPISRDGTFYRSPRAWARATASAREWTPSLS